MQRTLLGLLTRPPVPGALIAAGTVLLIASGLADNEVSMHKGIVHALQCAYANGNGFQACTTPPTILDAYSVGFALGASDAYVDGSYFSQGPPPVAVNENIQVWTADTGGCCGPDVLALVSAKGSWISDYWHSYGAPFSPDTWFWRDLMLWGGLVAGMVLCVFGLIARLRSLDSAVARPLTAATVGAVLTLMPLSLLIDLNLFGHGTSGLTAGLRIGAGLVGIPLAVLGSLVVRRVRQRTATGQATAGDAPATETSATPAPLGRPSTALPMAIGIVGIVVVAIIVLGLIAIGILWSSSCCG